MAWNKTSLDSFRACLATSLFDGKHQIFHSSMETLVWQHTREMEMGHCYSAHKFSSVFPSLDRMLLTPE